MNTVLRALGALSRRVRTLIVAGVAFVILLILTLTLPVPYVILSPGPTCNTIGDDSACGGSGAPIITIKGLKTPAKTSGNLNLTTVGVSTDSLTIIDALSAWLHSDQVVVPRSSVYPPGESSDQVNQQNTNDFAASQNDATAAAACYLGYRKAFGILQLSDKSPSAGKLAPGEAILSVDGKPAASYVTLKKVLATLQPGATVPVSVRPASLSSVTAPAPITESVTLGKPPHGSKGASLGVIVSGDPTCLTPYTVDLGLGNEIGGPSAGLMFALGILDKVKLHDLTNGAYIAGTGTIDSAGAVGPIGGIQLKMIAARRAGATVFLAPEGNCGDVRGNIPGGLKVVRVSTLSDAVADLQKLKDKQPVPSC